MQSTLNNRIANAQGAFWEPFPWGEPEVAYVNQFFSAADTLALSRVLYDAIIPWWDGVATGQLPTDAPEITPAFAEFAQIQHRMTKVVFSNTMEPSDGRVVLHGDLASQLAKLKQQDGADIILGCGPATLGPIASTPGLVDEYLIAVHPAVITAGPRMFDHLTRDLALELVHAEVFDAGSVVLHHRVVSE
jgi:dihydrofolate reductase